jgi:hypothetical protein
MSLGLYADSQLVLTASKHLIVSQQHHQTSILWRNLAGRDEACALVTVGSLGCPVQQAAERSDDADMTRRM